MDEKKSGYHWECKYCDCTRAIPHGKMLKQFERRETP